MRDDSPETPEPADLTEAAALAAKRAALAGLELHGRWRLRLRGDAMDAERALALLETIRRAAAPAGLVRRSRGAAGAAGGILLWAADGAPLRRGDTAGAGPEGGPDEQAAAAARFCDAVAARLGVGRGAVAALRGEGAEGPPCAAAWLPLEPKPDGTGWRALRRPAPTVRAGQGPVAGRLSDGAPALVIEAEPGRFAVWLPQTDALAAHLELIYTVGEAAAALRFAHLIDGAAAPEAPALRSVSLEPSPDGATLLLDAAPTPGQIDPVESAALQTALSAGWRPYEAELAIGDVPAGARRLALRPDAAARAAGFWLARPGMARAMGAQGRLDLSPSEAATLDAGLVAASRAGPDPLGLRSAALAGALGRGPIGFEAAGDGAALVFRNLAPPACAAEAASVALVAAAMLADAAARSGPARAPCDLALPRDAFDLPTVAWSDHLGALAELGGGERPPPSGWLRRGFLRRFPEIGRVETGEITLTAQRAAAPEGAIGVALLVRGRDATLEVDGRRAPLSRCPLTGGLVCGLRVSSTAPPPVVALRARSRAGRGAALTARLEFEGGGERLLQDSGESAPASGAAWAPSAFAPVTLDLRAPTEP